MDGLFFYVIALAILISFSAFFSGSEAALFSLTRAQVNQLQGQSAAGKHIAALLNRPRRLLITILIGNLIVNVFSTSAATSVAIGIFGEKGVGIAFIVMTVLILAFGEIIPKVIALNQSRRFSIAVVYPLRVFHVCFAVARWPFARFSDVVLDVLKRRLGTTTHHFSREELLTALDIGRDKGHLGDFEFDLLYSIIEFRETTVKEIMTPSINVFSLPIDLDPEDLLDRILENNYSRVPVYGDTTDDIKGVLHIKELLRIMEPDSDLDITSVLIQPYYVPESSKISALFSEMAKRRAHFALVIDEYGSFVGIVTVEDILEELVGEIRDMKEPRTTSHSFMADGRIVVLGTMEIEEFNEVFATDIVDEEHETIAGYVIGSIGEIPKAGETIEIKDLRFHIIAAQPNRIRKMRVEKI
ncbi:MAG: HlyC/CorC family transporter [Candidatus Latescibacterota bacterium]|nr:MAG: HlyC/CorC family transporter [Candidatus Latescibacterota bacterium]